MAKKAAPEKSYASGQVPSAGDAPDRGERRAFLRVSDIPSGGAVVTFNGRSRVEKGSYGSQWICEVRVAGKEYNWGIKIGGSVHRAIEALTGRKLKAGLRVNVEPREFTNDAGENIKFIAVVED